MTKVIGIDFGTKKVGIALSSEDAKFAFPVSVFPREKSVARVLELAQKEKVKDVVIGESTDFSMNDNPVMKEARDFARLLEENDLSIHFENEFMSSMQASRIQGYNKQQDASAAAIILQSYLDKQQNNGNN